jgi:Adenylate and Guanylate cyclase catalytic domain
MGQPAVSPLASGGELRAITSYKFLTEARQRRMLRRAFQHYLYPAVVEQVSQHPELLALGGEKRELTVLFSDIRGFSTFSEHLAPEALVQLLNEYFNAMTQAVVADDGLMPYGSCSHAGRQEDSQSFTLSKGKTSQRVSLKYLVCCHSPRPRQSWCNALQKGYRPIEPDDGVRPSPFFKQLCRKCRTIVQVNSTFSAVKSSRAPLLATIGMASI